MLAVLVPADSPDPLATYDLLRREAALYSPELAAKPHVVVVTKADLEAGALTPGWQPGVNRPDALIRGDGDAPVVTISAVTKQGLPQLLELLWRTLKS
jgi:GTP-binding protein